MFDRSSAHRHKEALPVLIVLDGKEPFNASVFVKVDERLSDLLNDPRPFLPVRREDGSVLMVAKSSIASIIERAWTETERAFHAQQSDLADPALAAGTIQATQERSAEEAQRRAAELDRLRAEVGAKRAAAKAAAEDPPSAQGSDEPEPQAEAAAAGPSEPPKSEHHAAGSGEERAEQPQRPIRPRRAFDPYAMLRVARGASVEEIKKAYKSRIKAVHPDIIASLDLDEDVVRAMHLTAQRINQAYDRIMREIARAEDQSSAVAQPEQGAA